VTSCAKRAFKDPLLLRGESNQPISCFSIEPKLINDDGSGDHDDDDYHDVDEDHDEEDDEDDIKYNLRNLKM
jgi:hypothetical protein